MEKTREIKFRAWDKKDKFMYIPEGIKLPYINERCILMQYTGLKDKNGKEIYEGDIVKLDTWQPQEMQICFIEGAFCLANKDGDYVGDIHYIQHADENQSQIIGNIYENPELLHSHENIYNHRNKAKDI